MSDWDLSGNRIAGPVASDGAQGDSESINYIAISADGSYVAFTSEAMNLAAVDTNGVWDVFVRKR